MVYKKTPKSKTLSSTLRRDFVNTRLLVHKHVKISVDEWILETTRPQKHVKFLELQRFNNTDGPFLKKLPKFETSSAPSAGATTRQTYKLTCGSGILATERNVLVEALCTALERRFDDTSVVKATAIADFKMWPMSEEELHTFGDDWMTTLLDQFGSYLDDKDDQIKAEWPMLKTAVLEAFLMSSDTTWLQVNRRFRNEYPHVLNFFDLILTIPATSAACEWDSHT